MPQFATTDELRRRMIQALELSGLTDVRVPGSATHLLVEPFIARQGEQASDLRNVFSNMFVQTASGFYLDLIGEEWGLQRVTNTSALVLATEEIIRFYVESGTLRDAIGSKIPQGTQITTEDGNVVFETDEALVPVGTDHVYVSAVSLNIGPEGNVNTGRLVRHSMQADGVFVINEEPITTGRSREPDALYRQRLLSRMRGNQNTTIEDVTAQLQGLPGVRSTVVIPTAAGITHPMVVMYGPDKLGPATVSMAEAVTAEFLPLGTRIVFRLPDYVSASLSIAVRHDGTNPVNLRTSIPSLVRRVIRDIPLGASYDFTRLDSDITRALPSVLDVNIIDIRINGRTHSNRRVTLRDMEQLLLDDVHVELID
jgi:hypothetical protein